MKRAFRERALSRLYADLESGDFDRREFALFQLALMLRRAKDEPPSPDDFPAEEHLSRELLRIRLSPADQEQIVAHLVRLVTRQADSRATALWALGEVSTDYAASALLSAAEEHGDCFSTEEAFQTCRALCRWLERDDRDRRLVNALIDACGPRSWLGRWSRSSDARLAKLANTVISLARQPKC